MEDFIILVINPGGTSTKIALFNGDKEILRENLVHSGNSEDIKVRERAVQDFLNRHLPDLGGKLDAIVTRGGPMKPLPSGTFRITEKMIADIKAGRVQASHISHIAPIMGYELGEEMGIPAFTVDPVSVDEMTDIARISGFPEVERKSLCHSLNTKAIARRAGKDLGKSYKAFNFVIAHLGSGISVSAHKRGKMIDTTNANEEAPFSAQRAGTVPTISLIERIFEKGYEKKEIEKKLLKKSGLLGYLGTDDLREVEKRVDEGDKKANLVFNALAYQISKSIGEMTVALKGEVDAILITGGMAYSTQLVDKIKEYTEFIAPLYAYPGEDEMRALAEGGLRILRKEEEEEVY